MRRNVEILASPGERNLSIRNLEIRFWRQRLPVEPKAGRHFTFPTPDRSAFQFAQVAFQVAIQYPEAKTIHLVMDNLNIHRRKSLTNLYGAEVGGEIWDRFTVHYTPTHGSWLNQAEIESEYSRGNASVPEESPT